MQKTFEIRADYDSDTLIVYQAYNEGIAKAALAAQQFVPPFSYNRMTWIKPSFLWMMERNGWGSKPNQEYTLAIRIKREAFEHALSLAVLSSASKRLYASVEEWREKMNVSPIRVQWDPERDLRSAKLDYRSVQIGISRDLCEAYATEWITEIRDYSPLVAQIQELRRAEKWEAARELLPIERPYPLPESVAKVIGAE